MDSSVLDNDNPTSVVMLAHLCQELSFMIVQILEGREICPYMLQRNVLTVPQTPQAEILTCNQHTQNMLAA